MIGAVLVGGRSRRFGRPKWSEPIGGVPMALRAARALAPLVREVVTVAPGPVEPVLGLEAIADAPGGAGPLGAVVAALERAAGAGDAGCLVLACDLPLVDERLLGALVARWRGEDVVAPLGDGRLHPLCALWSTGALRPARAALAGPDGSLVRLAERLVLRAVDEPEWRPLSGPGDPLLNVNTPGDFARAEALVRQGGAPGGRSG